jgi:hypothetical protein
MLAAGLVLAGTAFAFFVPLEDETCPQVAADLFGVRDGTLIRSTLWDCVWAAQRVAIRNAGQDAEENAQREKQRAMYEAQKAEAEKRAAAQKAEAARLAKEHQAGNETEVALIAALRATVCPELRGDRLSVGLLQAKGDLLLYQVEGSCPGCQYKREPQSRWRNVDGTVFCTTGGPIAGECDQKLAAAGLLFQTHREGPRDDLLLWLGCP